jgi:hypothetical protein
MAVSFQDAHFPKEIMLLGGRWYVAYPLSTRHVEALSGQLPIGGHAPVDRGRPCRSTWSNNHGTWGRCKPMRAASRHRAASCGDHG